MGSNGLEPEEAKARVELDPDEESQVHPAEPIEKRRQ